MNRLQCFALVTHQRDGKFWTEIVTVRSGELAARRSVFSLIRARRMADKLADRYGVTDRAGMYVGAIIRTDR